MSIAQRKDGRYVVKYKDGGTWKQRTFRTRADAVKFEDEAKIEEAVQDRLTFGELMTTFFRNNERHSQTIKSITSCLCGHYDSRTGKTSEGEGSFLFDRYPETLTRKDMERLREAYRVRGVRNSAINVTTSHLKAILSWGVEQEFIQFNPWRDIKRLPEKRRQVEVSKETFRAVYECAPAWLQWAMKTAFCLCLRPGLVELFGLKWSNFDFARGSVTIRQGKSGILKTVIPPKAYMEEAALRCNEDTAIGQELVCTKNGKRVTCYSDAWHRACRQAGVKMRPYDIRHLAATTMIAAGADISSVAAQLGHQNCAITGKFYAHVTSSGQRNAGQALAM